MKIEVPVHGTIIVNGKKYICKECSEPQCESCALLELRCWDILCLGIDRTDKKSVYFEPFDGVLYDSRPVKISTESMLPY